MCDRAGRSGVGLPFEASTHPFWRRSIRPGALESNLADLLHAEGREAESREHQRRAVVLFAEVAGSPAEMEPGIWQLVEW